MKGRKMNLKFWKRTKAPAPVSDSYVTQFYQMNPDTDDLLLSGYALLGGMVVLIEDNMFRQDLRLIETSSYAKACALENNRWCTVSDVSFHDIFDYYEGGGRSKADQTVRFVATYEDGSKKVRQYGVSYAWFVKKASIPVFVEPETPISF